MEAVLDLVARTAKYQADLASAGNFTKSQINRMVTDFHRAELATNKTAAAMQKFKGSEQAITRGKEAVSNLAQALSVLAPEAGAAVQQIGAMGGALKAAMVVGPLAAGIAALAITYKTMAAEAARTTQIMAAERDALQSLEPSTRALEDARLALANTTGTLTDAELAYQKAAVGSQRAVEDFAKSQQSRRDELRRTVEGDRQGLLANLVPTSVYSWYNSANVEAARRELAVLDRAMAQHAETQKEIRDVTIETTQAKRENRAAVREASVTYEHTTSAAESYLAVLREIAGIEASYTSKTMDATQRLTAEYETQTATIEARRDAAMQLVSGNASAVEEAQRQARDAQLAVDEWYYGELDALRQQDAAAAQKLAEEQAQREAELARYQVNTAASMFGSIADLANTAGQANEENAINAFYIQQAASAAQVAILGIQEIARGYAEGGVWGAAAAAVAVAAQEAAIWAQSPPSFYSGGLMPESGTTGIASVLHPGEAVLNRQGRDTLGDDTIRAANRGEGMNRPVVIEWKTDRGVQGAMMAREVRHGGRLSQELSRNTGRLGHRS